MTARITTTEALRLARAAFDDDARDDRAPCYTDRTLKLALAVFVERVFKAEVRESDSWAQACGATVRAQPVTGVGDDDREFRIDPREARSLAASLWRAADEAESKESR